MLRKTQRLTKAGFDTYFKVGKRIHHPLLQLIYAPHKNFHGSVVVGKKVSKKAVIRNLLRRRVYGQLYRWSQEGGRTGVHIIILKPAAQSATKKQIAEALDSTLARIS